MSKHIHIISTATNNISFSESDTDLVKEDKVYLCIDLKSFYASVESIDRGLDPFTTNLVVADPSRGKGSICLAITPALKRLGVRNRCRLFEIPRHIKYITAIPRMNRYMSVSTQIYGILLRYLAPEDIHIYSIDENFIDLTPYLNLYKKTPREIALLLMKTIHKETGISSSAGIGSNLFLSKVALDILAKHSPDSVAILTQDSFKSHLWHHRPLTDIWQIGPGIAKRLAHMGIYDLHGITAINEEHLYKIFGINAELLIDHAWGRESCTMADIHAFRAQHHSIHTSQILMRGYSFSETLLPLQEMVDNLTLELIEKNVMTNTVSLYVGYEDKEKNKNASESLPRTGGSRKLSGYTDSYERLWESIKNCYEETTLPHLFVRRLGISFNNLEQKNKAPIYTSLFPDTKREVLEKRDLKARQAIIAIKDKYGKNALLRGLNLQEHATGRLRNTLVGGHNGGDIHVL